jgi:hypothetical protein
VLSLWLLVACQPDLPVDGPQVLFAPNAGFWASPFPGDHRREGVVDLSELPGVEGVPLLERAVALLDGIEDGFGTTVPIWLPLDREVDLLLPDAVGSLAVDATVGLVDVDPASPERGRRIPVSARVMAGTTASDPERALVLVPIHGVPLREGTRYAAYARTGTGLVPSAGLDAALANPGWQEAADELGSGDLAALTVFTTGRPTEALRDLMPVARADGLAWEQEPVLSDAYGDLCVYSGQISVPVYQRGEVPYATEGGGFGPSPSLVRRESSRVVLTVPRGAGGEAPVVVFVRTGGGGDRPLVDRSVHTTTHGPDTPGEGYGRQFAAAGYVGVQIDGPLGGLRNTTGGDEQFLTFNVVNPEALRDNLRQSALELALLPDLLSTLTLGASDCAGALTLRTDRMALFGHSMGASIAPLVLPIEPRYDALVLSGAGGSFALNVLYKRSPLPVLPIIATLLDVDEGDLSDASVPIGLLQWAGEAADVPPSAWGARDRLDVLMTQGIVDTYILPPIANVATVSLGLDLGGPALDVGALPDLTGVAEVIGFGGGAPVGLPLSGNRSDHTRVVVQRAEDGVEDGHEIAFQSEAARAQVQTFLASRLLGTPVVRADP